MNKSFALQTEHSEKKETFTVTDEEVNIRLLTIFNHVNKTIFIFKLGTFTTFPIFSETLSPRCI